MSQNQKYCHSRANRGREVSKKYEIKKIIKGIEQTSKKSTEKQKIKKLLITYPFSGTKLP